MATDEALCQPDAFVGPSIPSVAVGGGGELSGELAVVGAADTAASDACCEGVVVRGWNCGSLRCRAWCLGLRVEGWGLRVEN